MMQQAGLQNVEVHQKKMGTRKRKYVDYKEKHFFPDELNKLAKEIVGDEEDDDDDDNDDQSQQSYVRNSKFQTNCVYNDNNFEENDNKKRMPKNDSNLI